MRGCLDMSSLEIKFLGSGDAFGSGGRAYFFAKKVKYHLDYETLLANSRSLRSKKIVVTI